MRIAIYARYSSDLQDARSITDQVAAARDYAARHGWHVVAEFADAAISGASMANRPELAQLLSAAGEGAFDAVLTESLDRLSRDLEDIAGIHKRLLFRGVQLVTIADGVVGTLHVGLRGIVGKLYLEDLAQKTRRGQVGRARAGRIPGGRCYGYDVVAGAERGVRAINEGEAEIVRRIYREYAAGVSPMVIVKRLNADAVPGPRGGYWNVSTLLGSRKRRNGILNADIYGGRLVYNRQQFVKNPVSGKRQARANAPADWITVAVPELAIVDAETWSAVESRRHSLGRTHLTHRRRPKHLLSGLLACGVCGAAMIVQTRVRAITYFGCSTRLNRGACTNTRLAPAPDIEARVLAGLRGLLLAPDLIELAVRTYQDEQQRLAREQVQTRGMTERELARVQGEIGRVVAAIRAGGEIPALVDALRGLEARRLTLEHRLPKEATPVVAPHPRAAARYREIVDAIESQLRADDMTASRAIEIVRALIDRVTVLPTPGRRPLQLELSGDVAALIAIADGTEPERRNGSTLMPPVALAI